MELKNNQVEFRLRYTGTDPKRAFALARTSLTFKGFTFPDMGKPVEHLEQDGEYTVTLIGTNQFLPETPEPEQKTQPISTMNNAPLSQSRESIG